METIVSTTKKCGVRGDNVVMKTPEFVWAGRHEGDAFLTFGSCNRTPDPSVRRGRNVPKGMKL